MLARPFAAALAIVMSLAATSSVEAQPLGTFTWQLQPFCNRVTFAVTQVEGAFMLAGYDDQCGGGADHAAASGVASLNPDGSVNLGISIITPDVGTVHVDATLDVGTLSGPWRDSFQYDGTLALNGAAPGSPRPSPHGGFHYAGGYNAAGPFGGGFFFGLGHNGPRTAPTAIRFADTLGRFGAGGHHGGGYNWPTGLISMDAAEDWTPMANGTRMVFMTTPIGATSATEQMLIDYNGFVGIGTGNQRPEDRLHVRGDIRVGTGGANGCLKSSNGGTIIGVCASDARFKRDVTAYHDVLSRVAALRPVTFSWRSESFPEHGFGPDREAGLIAQDVEQVLPELVVTAEDGYKAVNYSRLPLLAIEAIKELKEKNDALEARLAALEALVKK